MILALVGLISRSVLLAKFVNIFFFLVSVFILCRISRRIDKDSEVYVPLLFVVYPLISYSTSALYPQVLGLMLFSCILYLILDFSRLNLRRLFLAGLFMGALVLSIPSFIFIVPFFCFVLIFYSSRNWHEGKKFLICFLLPCLLLVSAWTARNYSIWGKIIPVSTNSGINLLLGNSENAGPNTGTNADISKYVSSAKDMNEVEKDVYYRLQAKKWVQNHPSKAVILYFKKVLNYFNFELNLATKLEKSYTKETVLFVSYYSILGLALMRFFYKKKLSRVELILWVFYVGNAFLAALFFTRVRFRIPFDGILIVLAAVSLKEAQDNFFCRKKIT
jgi:4-amino-4-deoxy-L-arabinose transferase-like glycosyltransferase